MLPAVPDDSPPPPVPKHDPYAALRLRNYRWFVPGFALSATGLMMLSTAIGWEIYERTDSELHLGYAGLARALPVIVLALPGGQAADLFSRKAIVAASQVAFAALGAILAWVSFAEGPLWSLYLILVLTGCVRAFNGPARGSLLPLLVPPEHFHNAVTWNTGVFHAAGVAGPVLAGLLIAASGEAWPVYACMAAASLGFAVCACFLRPRVVPRIPGRFTIRSMLGGLGYVRRERVVLGAILIDCLGVLFGGATALLPVFARDILSVGPEGLGALRAAPYIGAVVTAVILAHRPPFKRAGRTFLLAVALWAVAVIGFGLSTSFVAALLFLALQGAIDNISVVIRHVLVQVRTPDELRGRVTAVNSMFIEVSNELGGFESGAASAAFRAVTGATIAAGAVFSVVSGGVGTLAVLGIVAWRIPELRKLGKL